MVKRPNIVLFNVDQWRGDVVGHLGNPAVSTPVLDKLAHDEAVSFRWAFCQNPVCTPSRCSFMTGWYPHTRGHRTMSHMLRESADETTLLRVLKENGYHVWWGGKNDLVPGQEGYGAHCDVKFNPTPDDWARWGLTPRKGLHQLAQEKWGDPFYYSFFVGELEKDDEEWYGETDVANVLGAIDEIRRHAHTSHENEKPLCLYLPLIFPHPPYACEEPYLSAVDRAKLPPRRRFEEATGKPKMLHAIRENQGLQEYGETNWTELRATYYAMCARTDALFGLLCDALHDAGIYDDTAILFFSDHGDYTGDYDIAEKNQNTFEDCLSRVPFLIKPPASVACDAGISNTLVELVDIPATVCDLAKITLSYTQFGRSLVSLLTDREAAHRDAVFCEGGRLLGEEEASEKSLPSASSETSLYGPRVRVQIDLDNTAHGKAVMCRTKTHKYVYRLYEPDELYDLRSDPQEMTNVVENAEYVSILAELRLRTLRWFAETGDFVPRDYDARS